MFLNNLNFQQKKIFLGMAKKILIADDGSIDSMEENYLRSICNEMSVGIDDEMNIDFTQLKDLFSSEEESRLVVVELIALAYSNDDYHENQKKYIMDMIQYLGLNKNILPDIEGLVELYFKTQKNIISFIAPEEM